MKRSLPHTNTSTISFCVLLLANFCCPYVICCLYNKTKRQTNFHFIAFRRQVSYDLGLIQGKYEQAKVGGRKRTTDSGEMVSSTITFYLLSQCGKLFCRIAAIHNVGVKWFVFRYDMGRDVPNIDLLFHRG